MLNPFSAGMTLARRRCLGRWRWLVTLLVFSTPIVLTLVARRFQQTQFNEIYISMVSLLMGGVLVPYAASFFGSSMVGDEVEGKTLVYLWTRPVGRAQVFLCEFVAVMAFVCAALAVSVTLTYAAVFSGMEGGALRSNLMMPVWDVLALGAGGMAYGAIAFLLSAVVKKPLSLMIVYIVTDNVVQFLPGFIKLFFIRHYVYVLSSHPQANAADGLFKFLSETQTTETQAAVTLVLVVVVALGLGAFILNRREFLGDDPARSQ